MEATNQAKDQPFERQKYEAKTIKAYEIKDRNGNALGFVKAHDAIEARMKYNTQNGKVPFFDLRSTRAEWMDDMEE